jgi:hypothetical protein
LLRKTAAPLLSSGGAGKEAIQMEMSGMGMVGCVVAYVVPLILSIVILVKVNRIAKVQDSNGPRV